MNKNVRNIHNTIETTYFNFKMNSKEKTKIIKPQSARTAPKIFEKNKVIQVPFEENPFENAIKENEKIELKLEQERLKLIDFNRKVKERIRDYKYAKQKLEEDAQLIIYKRPSVNSFKKKSLDKMVSKSALDLRETPRDASNTNLKKPYLSSISCRSEENLSNFVLKTIIEQKSVKEEYKKRIKSTRKIYSNMERDKVRNENVAKNFRVKSANSESDGKKTEMKKNTKKRDNVKIERNHDCLLNHKTTNNNELKQFIFDTYREPIIEKKLIEKQKVPKKIALSTPKPKPKQQPITKIDKYICYMKQVLREKANQYKIDIPPLCQCHLTNFRKENVHIWDVDWNKCANNCLFYQNPKGIFSFFFSFKQIFLFFIFKNMQEFYSIY